MFMYWDRFDWLAFHIDIPDLDGEVVAAEDVSTIMREADIRDRGDDFREEGARRRVFLLFKLCKGISKSKMYVSQGGKVSRLACWSHRALSRMSASLMVPFELAYMNQLQLWGWNSAAVITSVSSSIFAGFISTMLKL